MADTVPLTQTDDEVQRVLADAADAVPAGVLGERHRRTLAALADVDAGRLIDDDVIRAWADGLASGQEESSTAIP